MTDIGHSLEDSEMKVRTPNNTNIRSFLEPNTTYDIIGDVDKDGYFTYDLVSRGKITNGYTKIKGSMHLNGQDWIIVDGMPNREKLADFIKMNNIKMTKVSQTVGKARNWLHVMTTEKRRGDLSDKALQAILKLIHIDWTKDQVIKVKATKEHTAYFTRTSSYKTVAHKERLQRAMWNGEFIV